MLPSLKHMRSFPSYSTAGTGNIVDSVWCLVACLQIEAHIHKYGSIEAGPEGEEETEVTLVGNVQLLTWISNGAQLEPSSSRSDP